MCVICACVTLLLSLVPCILLVCACCALCWLSCGDPIPDFRARFLALVECSLSFTALSWSLLCSVLADVCAASDVVFSPSYPHLKKKKDKKKKKQNEGLQSPAEKTPEEKDISPEINKIAAPSSSQTAGKTGAVREMIFTLYLLFVYL